MYDHVLNIYFAQARMYDPTIRRFMAVDPIRGTIFNPQSMVAYTYVLNNPLRWVDPLGLSPHAVDLESFVENAGGAIDWNAGTITVGGETRDFSVLAYGNSQGGVDVDANSLAWMFGAMDNDWMDDLCDFERGFLLGAMAGSDNIAQAMQALFDARNLHSEGRSIMDAVQGELFDFAHGFATFLTSLDELIPRPPIPSRPSNGITLLNFDMAADNGGPGGHREQPSRGVLIVGIEYTLDLPLGMIFGPRINTASGTISDTHGNRGTMSSVSGGVSIGMGAGVGVFVAIIDAPTIHDVEGGSVEIGLSIGVNPRTIPTPYGIPLEISFDRGWEITVSTGEEEFFGVIYTAGMSLGIGSPLLFSLPISFTPFVQYTHTNVTPVTPPRGVELQ